MKAKAIKPSKAQLARKVLELEALLSSTLHFADATLHKSGNALMASGVLVQLSALGGNEITPPFVIRDGFSPETIAAIRADIARSYALATLYKPKGV